MYGKMSVKVRIFAVSALCALIVAGGAHAVMPYQQPIMYQQPSPGYYQQPQPMYQQPQPVVYQQPSPVRGYIPAYQVARMPQAVPPGRITGALPKVGNAYVNAGRKYYQPEGFDRLADSGLYIGLSLGYTYSLKGGMIAEYQEQPNAWYVPGAFREAGFAKSSVMPLQLSVGAALNNDLRVDFAYLRYSGISYPSSVMISDGGGGFISAGASGGRISSSTTMLNVYYNLDSYTGVLASGSLRPYVGVGLGIGTTTIADYLIYDGNFYPDSSWDVGITPPAGETTAVSDVYAYHSGGTTEQLAYAIELGTTTELDGGLKLDFFVRWANLGRVESSGSIVVTQTEWFATGLEPIGTEGSEMPAPYDTVYHYTNWKEGGQLTAIDLGIRMRIQF
jgi:hypothetical protein